MSDTQQTEDRTFADLTPYAAMKIVNVVLARAGLTTKVTSQSMYGRAAHGVIEAYRLDGDSGTWMFDGAAFAAWLAPYVEGLKNGTAQARVDYAALAEQYV